MLRYRVVIDIPAGPESSILVLGSGRSGTTWVAAVISGMTGARPVFEPFVLDENGEFVVLRTRKFDKAWLTPNRVLYIDPEAGPARRYHADIERILCGRLKNEWVDRDTRGGIYRRRVIKGIRANLLMPYLIRAWPALKIVWLVRSPFEVVGSQFTMASRLGWTFDQDNEVIAGAGRLDNWLAESLAAMEKATSPVEKMAHRWCIENLFPYRHELHRHPNLRLMSYESLTGDPAAWQALSRFVAGADWTGRGKFADLLRQQSSTSLGRFDPAFRSAKRPPLPAAEARSVEAVLDRYGALDVAAFGGFAAGVPPAAA